MSEMCCTRLAENPGRKKSPFWLHRTTLSGYIFGTKTYIDNWKKNLLKGNTSSTCPDNMVKFGLLTAETCWRVWSTPSNFNGFRVLAALLHSTRVNKAIPQNVTVPYAPPQLATTYGDTGAALVRPAARTHGTVTTGT